MKKITTIFLFFTVTLILRAQQEETYDYFRQDKDMITQGVQAILTCNGLFTSNRTIEQVYDQELKYLPQPIGTAKGGDYKIDYDRKTVAIGLPGGVPVMRAVYREGIGCVMLAPDQTFEVIDDLPIQSLAPLADDAAKIAWPDGDLVPTINLPKGVNATGLLAASDWAFDRETPELSKNYP